MTSRYFSILLILACAGQLLAFAGGDGSQANPFQVSTLAELDDVRNYLDSCFIQIADIDASETSTWNNGLGWEPIGDDNAPFTGVYDGQSHAVSGVHSHREESSDVGLFGQTSGATITNLLSLDCDVLGSARVGGLVGYHINSTILNCGSTGLSRGTWATGGLIGKSLHSTITDCYSLADVEMFEVGERKGGLAGLTDGCTVTNCYARGSVTGGDFTGGLIGAIDNSDLVDCYAAGPMTVVGEGGGLVGHVIGECTATRCYWDTEATGMSTSDLGAGKTTAEMTYFYKLHADGWDFLAETVNGEGDAWDIDMSGVVNDGYPCLAWENAPNFLQPPAGEGVQGDPHLIATLFDLFWIRANDDAWNHWFLQTADIDASDTQNWNNSAGFHPIGESNGYGFSGLYDGDGHTIDGLCCREHGNYGGLFGYVNYALIRNLTLTNVDIDYYFYSGALAGFVFQSSIENCHSSGAVEGSNTGGLAGKLATSSTMYDCSSSATVEGQNETGGLVGYVSDSQVHRSFSTGVAICDDLDAGGLVGWLNSSGSLYDCYSTGSVNGTYCGGLVADHDGAIYRCYSTGHVSGLAMYGGLVAWSSGTITDSFWDTETSGQSSSHGGGVGLTTAEMKNLFNYISAGWDFEKESANGSDNVWDMDMSGGVNSGYPYMSWQDGDAVSLEDLAGSGTADDPYLIGSLYDLWCLSDNDQIWNGYFLQTADIDASDTQNWNSGAGFRPIGITESTPFTGCYNGDNHEISNLYINRTGQCVGLFAAASNGSIKNLGLVDASINSSTIYGDGYGILIGRAEDVNVDHCYVTGSMISSGRYVGALIGYMLRGRCVRCYSHASVSGAGFRGGLLGLKGSVTLVESFATGSVNPGGNAGGLAGYSTGANAVRCFWDVQTTGIASSVGGGVGLNTAELQTLDTYIAAGWDFEGELGNGGDDFWMFESGEYPIYNIYDTPVITAVQDVANDQGHLLKVWWDRAFNDDAPSVYRFYSVWRQVDDTRAIDPTAIVIDNPSELVQRREDAPRPVILLQRDTMWTCLATIPAMGHSSYVYFAPTLVDSSAALSPGQYESSFGVFFHYEDRLLSSNIGVGCSVDNIPPFPTDNVRVAVNTSSRNASLTLTWDEVTQGGLNGNSYPEQNGVWYRVYGGASPDFACDETSLLTVTQETSCDVDITTYDRRYFKVTASDQP